MKFLCRERLAWPCFDHASGRVRHPVERERDRLMRELPDRKRCAEDEEGVDHYLQHVALFLFRTDQQSVGGFKVLHKVGLIDANCLCNARAKILIINLSRWQ